MAPKNSMSQAHRGRSEKRDTLRALESGELSIEALLRAPNGPLERTDVWEVVLHIPRFNRKGAKRLFMESGVFPHKQLGELSDSERELLIAALPKRVKERSKPTSSSSPSSEPSSSA